MKHSVAPYRDELFISTKVGHDMWSGLYGACGFRKSLMDSLNQSLRLIHLEYVDICYFYRYDPEMLLKETMQVWVNVVLQG